MVTTRSQASQTTRPSKLTKATKAQRGHSNPTKSEKPQSTKKTPTKQRPVSPNTKRKRTPAVNHEDHSSSQSPNKRIKKSTSTPIKNEDERRDAQPDAEPIIINRAPVLQLWSASIAHQRYPSLSWESCLSIGAAISAICAVAKSRAIGTVAEKNTSRSKQKKRNEAKLAQKELEEVEVMHFKLRLKDGLALVGSENKGKPGSEEALKKKFGEREYESVKGVFEEVLSAWKGNQDELNTKGIHFYEGFRPEVKAGQKGWGRKGELDLEEIRRVVVR